MVISGKSAAAALVKARAAMKATVTKDAKANYGSYATLAAVMEAITPALVENGLALVQEAELGDGYITVGATLLHESGESIEFIPLTMPLGNQRTPQAAGSAITYGRRYQLTALFGLAPDDDDGAEASKTPQQPQERTTPNHATQSRQTQQRPTTRPTANVDDAPEVDPDGPQTIEGTPPHQRFFGTGLSIFGPDWDAGARHWLIERWTAKNTPKDIRTSSTLLSDDEKDVLTDYMNEHAAELQRVWKNAKPNRVMKEAA